MVTVMVPKLAGSTFGNEEMT